MSVDAVRDLRDWQRREASVQERALRAAAKAHTRLRQLDDQRAVAVVELARAVDELVAAGISREQASAFLGLDASALARKLGPARPPSGGRKSTEASPHKSGSGVGIGRPQLPS